MSDKLIKYTDKQIQELLWYNGINDEETGKEILAEEVYKEMYDVDLGKATITYDIVVHDYKDNKYYRAKIRESEYDKHSNIEWKEVFPKQMTITVYE